MTNDNEDMRLIVTKRGEYVLPRSSSMSWEERYPGMTPPKRLAAGRFWPTPDGIVFAMPEGEP